MCLNEKSSFYDFVIVSGVHVGKRSVAKTAFYGLGHRMTIVTTVLVRIEQLCVSPASTTEAGATVVVVERGKVRELHHYAVQVSKRLAFR